MAVAVFTIALRPLKTKKPSCELGSSPSLSREARTKKDVKPMIPQDGKFRHSIPDASAKTTAQDSPAENGSKSSKLIPFQTPDSQEPQSSNQEKPKPTDDEIGDMLITAWDGNVRFFFGAWHQYSDGVWKQFDGFKWAIWEQLIKLKPLRIRPNASKVSSVEHYLQTFLCVQDSLIDNQHQYINLRNGLFNVETGELEPHKRESYMTSQLPFAYDRNAEAPTFKRFLNQSLVKDDGTPDYDLELLILEAMGYSLTSNTDFRASFWLVGESGTGKSVLINTLQDLAGNSHVTIDLDQLTQNSYQLADIAGKRVVTFTEPKANSVLADNHYKRLVSQDAISARQIYGNPFRFVPICKVWGAMNETPRVIDRSDAIFNRVFIIPMNRPVPIEQRDPRLQEKLRAEMAGIFNMALIGLKRITRAKAFTQVKQVNSARADYKAENDTEAAFVAECCVRDANAKTNAQTLYDAYAAWCKRNGTMAKSKLKVARDWQRLGFVRIHERQANVYQGLRIAESTEPF